MLLPCYIMHVQVWFHAVNLLLPCLIRLGFILPSCFIMVHPLFNDASLMLHPWFVFCSLGVLRAASVVQLC